MITGSWQSPPAVISLEAKTAVHIWRIPLVLGAAQRAEAQRILSEEERKKIARLHFEAHRQQKTASCLALRSILARYLSMAPQDLEFDRGAQGKPVLCNAPEDLPIRFNLSHSGDLALCAVALDVEVGVDLERVSERVPITGVAKRFFAPEESRALLALPQGDQREMFYRYWTLKEAYIKALGRGISSHPMRCFVVEPRSSGWGCLRRVEGSPEGVEGWRLGSINPGNAQYLAALALRSGIPRLTFWNYLPVAVDITC